MRSRVQPWFAPLLSILVVGFAAAGARAEIIDRIAAVVEGQVLTASTVEQLASTNLVPRLEGETPEAYRRRVLSLAIDFILQRRDAERFGLRDVRPEDIDARVDRLALAGESREAMMARFHEAGMTEEDLRTIIRQRLQIEAYIEERFAPLIFVPLEEIESYYGGAWSQRRREQGEPIPPLADVREELREALRAERLAAEVRRWSEQLRNRANVDIYAYQ